MKTSLKNISPDFPRIAHFNSDISQMTHDDVVIEHEVEYPLDCYYQEKVDGANLGVSWYKDGPVLRNKNFILKKGYSKIRTPAKQQFRSAWNWLHEHENDIKEVSKRYQTEVTIYGEWMWAQHSLGYEMLPDWFLAYNIYSVQDHNFLNPEITLELLKGTNIHYIPHQKVQISGLSELKTLSEMSSRYRDGISEGIVIKTIEDRFTKDMYKIVNSSFTRREDFNTTELVKNKLKR